MKQMMAVYDQAGNVFFTREGTAFPESVAMAICEVPDGYYVESVNVETGEPVLAEIPKTDIDARLAALEAQVAAMTGTEE